MRRGWRIGLVVAVAVAALLVVNAVVVDAETKPAEVTVEGAEIHEGSSIDLQLLDEPPEGGQQAGPPIVLLHCYACSMRWWDRLAPLLRTRHRVIRVDLIGHGGSQKPSSGYSIESQAAAVGEALSDRGIEGATVVGHSLGGVVAVALAERASQLVDRVVVIGTGSRSGQSSLPPLARAARTPIVGEAMWRLRMPPMIRAGYRSAFAPGFDLEAAFEDPDQVVVDSRAMTYTAYDSASPAAGDFQSDRALHERLTAAGAPLLALLGAEDEILDTEAAADDYRAVPGAEVRVLQGVGHSANLEAPEDAAETILRFAGGDDPARNQR